MRRPSARPAGPAAKACTIVRDHLELFNARSSGFLFSVNGTNYTFGDGPNRIFTGQVERLDSLFAGTFFNDDIGYWDTSNVTSMNATFESAQWFNQNIGGWDTSKVTNMFQTFYGARLFDQDIGGWDTANVTSMY